MSVKNMTWVFEHSPYTLGSRLVHLALADVSNDANGNRLWIHQAAVAEKAAISESQVQRILKKMVEDGALVLIEKGGGRGKPNVYELVLETPQIAGESKPETPATGTVNPRNGHQENPASQQSHLLPTKEGTEVERKEENQPLFGALASVTVGALEKDFFDAFWEVYPRREAKLAARKAWGKATKTIHPARIIAGAIQYRDDPNRDPTWTAHPATWLNAGRWDDDPLPSRNGKATDPLKGRHDISLDEQFARATGGS